jgi:DNA-binding HxlR family transcriptional regulator
MDRKSVSCPVQATLDIIGGKWKVLILWHLHPSIRRFGELKRLIPEITPRMLTQQLRELEQDGLITRKIYAEIPPRVEYSLSNRGQTLVPVLRLMCKWGNEQILKLKKKNQPAA